MSGLPSRLALRDDLERCRPLCLAACAVAFPVALPLISLPIFCGLLHSCLVVRAEQTSTTKT